MEGWNVRSMVDVEGPIAIASHAWNNSTGEEKMVDLIIRELDRYKIDIK